MGLIYKATVHREGKTDKYYIGLTTQSFQARKKQHLSKAKKGEKSNFKGFVPAIIKHGEENVDWEILEDNIDNDKLDEREIYYIN